jgi:D-alanyl-D-alanine carboxypeptidase/D-alanyl-D-alanine-endopeptidase (penicillin-binding protein 4)
VFDNAYTLYLASGAAGSRPRVLGTEPKVEGMRFHNQLMSATVRTDSAYIAGMPFSGDRFLYGVVPEKKERVSLKGSIPDPPLFLAQYFTAELAAAGIAVDGEATCRRLLVEGNAWKHRERTPLVATHSPTLLEIVRVVNERSHNLYAEALLKTLGVGYTAEPGEAVSSTGRGIRVVEAWCKAKGLNVSALRMYDGSGLAASGKITAAFVCDLLRYMKKESEHAGAFIASLPRVGTEGTVASFLRDTPLMGAALLKSGGMEGIRSYAGYVTRDDRTYAVALF